MSLDSLIDERFSVIGSALTDATSDLQDFLEDLSNINRNIDSLSVNVSVNQVEGPTELTGHIQMTDPSPVEHISSQTSLTPTRPQLPSLSRYLELLAEIRDLAYTPLAKYSPTTLDDIDFSVEQPDILDEVPIEERPQSVTIEDFTYYTFDELLIPSPLVEIPEVSVDDIDLQTKTAEDYIDSDSNLLLDSILSLTSEINTLLQAVVQEENLNNKLEEIKETYLSVSDEWVEQKLSTPLETFSFTSFEKRNDLPQPQIAENIKNNGIVEIFGKGRVEIFEKIEREKDKYQAVEYEAVSQIKRNLFDTYLSLLKYKYAMAIDLWGLALDKYRASLTQRKAVVMLHESMIKTVEEYIRAYEEAQSAYRAQIEYDNAFVAEANATVEKIQSEVNLYKEKVAAYKTKVSEIEAQLEQARARIQTYTARIDNKVAQVKRNQAAFSANQGQADALSLELDAKKNMIDSKILEAANEKINYEGKENILKYALSQIELSRENALLRMKIRGQEQEQSLAKLQAAFDKLATIEQLYIAKTENAKAHFVETANNWAFNEASNGIRSNVRTIKEIVNAISKIALTGYEPLAALAGGLANTVDAMVTGVYEALTNI